MCAAELGELYRGVIIGLEDMDGETVYKVSYQKNNNNIEKWLYSDWVTADNIGDPIEMTRGRPIVYADGLDVDNLDTNDYLLDSSDYFVRKCSLCRLYYRDIHEHLRVVHGMDENQIFLSEVSYASTPRQFHNPRRDHSTPVPRRSIFF